MMGSAALLCGVASLLQAVAGCSYLTQGRQQAQYMGECNIRKAVRQWLSDDRAEAEATYGHISSWDTSRVTDMSDLFCPKLDECRQWIYSNPGAEYFNEDISAWDTSGVTTMSGMFYGASAFDQDIGDWAVDSVTDMEWMFRDASAFDQDLGWCVGNDVDLEDAFDQTKCKSTSCGVAQKDVIGICEPWARPCLIDTKTQCIINSPTLIIIIVLVLAGFGACVCCRKKKDETYAAAARRVLWGCLCCCCFCCRKKTEPSSVNSRPASPPLTPTTAFLQSLETRSPTKPETRAAAKAKFAPPFQRPGFTRKLSSFLFGEQEEDPTALTVAEAEEASTEQLPPPPPRRWFSRAEPEPEPAAPKAEDMYNRIAAWYNEPENAALRATWGAYPESEDFQTWPGFVAVTNAFLDREAG